MGSYLNGGITNGGITKCSLDQKSEGSNNGGILFLAGIIKWRDPKMEGSKIGGIKNVSE